jgi:hypothetical protein
MIVLVDTSVWIDFFDEVNDYLKTFNNLSTEYRRLKYQATDHHPHRLRNPTEKARTISIQQLLNTVHETLKSPWHASHWIIKAIQMRLPWTPDAPSVSSLLKYSQGYRRA